MGKLRVGIALTGSFCNFEVVLNELEKLAENDHIELYPIMSESSSRFDTRFGKAKDWRKRIKEITGNDIIQTIVEAQLVDPKINFHTTILPSCTRHTLANLATAITDTTVTMACKEQLSNIKPLFLALAINDGLSANGKNI